MRARKQDSFNVGDIVWAQADNECSWPAKISEKLPHQLYEVSFFNDNSTATLRAKAISDFEEKRNSLQNIRKDMKFKEAVRLAANHLVRKKRSQNRANDSSPYQSVSAGKVKQEQSPPVESKRKRIVKTMDVETPPKPEPRKPSRYTRKAIPVKSSSPPKQKKLNRMESQHDSDEEQPSLLKAEEVLLAEQSEQVGAMETEPPHQTVNLSMLKRLRQIIDKFLEQIFIKGKSNISRPSAANINALQEIINTLKKTDLQVEDMMVKRISNSLFFIARRLSGINEYHELIDDLDGQLQRLKSQLLQKFSNTEAYDQQFR